MSGSANLYVQMEPELKEQAESILGALGIQPSSAITLFYKQIVLKRGMPFDVRLPAHRLPSTSSLTSEQMNQELEKGFADIRAGRTVSINEAFAGIRNGE